VQTLERPVGFFWTVKVYGVERASPHTFSTPQVWQRLWISTVNLLLRNRDHTLTPFQCPQCQCRNIKRRNLIPNLIQDELFVSQCIQATIDAFWSRSTGTLTKHLGEIWFKLRVQRALGFNCLPPLGPWSLGSHLGMAQAIASGMLMEL
jgi:hypothetical protein